MLAVPGYPEMSSLSRFQIPPPDLLSIGETSGAFIYGREDRFFLAPSQLGREVSG